jgi:hypothetical protein
MMILTTNAKYEIPIDSWVAKATGDLVCPVCNYFEKDVEEIFYYYDRPIVFVDAKGSSGRVSSRRWFITEDLGLVCSPECLELHNMLGGGIYTT